MSAEAAETAAPARKLARRSAMPGEKWQAKRPPEEFYDAFACLRSEKTMLS